MGLGLLAERSAERRSQPRTAPGAPDPPRPVALAPGDAGARAGAPGGGPERRGTLVRRPGREQRAAHHRLRARGRGARARCSPTTSRPWRSCATGPRVTGIRARDHAYGPGARGPRPDDPQCRRSRGPWPSSRRPASLHPRSPLLRAMNLVFDASGRRRPGRWGPWPRGRFLFLVPWRERTLVGTAYEPADDAGAPEAVRGVPGGGAARVSLGRPSGRDAVPRPPRARARRGRRRGPSHPDALDRPRSRRRRRRAPDRAGREVHDRARRGRDRGGPRGAPPGAPAAPHAGPRSRRCPGPAPRRARSTTGCGTWSARRWR